MSACVYPPPLYRKAEGLARGSRWFLYRTVSQTPRNCRERKRKKVVCAKPEYSSTVVGGHVDGTVLQRCWWTTVVGGDRVLTH